MSAFLVSEKTFRRALGAVLKIEAKNTTAEQDEILGRKMLAVNCAALGERYGKGEEKDAKAACAHYSMAPDQTCSLHQSLKSLNCLLYQCSEGKVPKTEIFKRMQLAAYQLADMIVYQMPEYDAAEWD